MFHRKKIPKWVSDLPRDDSNRELLIKIAESSKNPLETPREVIFGVKDIKGIQAAQNIELYSEQQGWGCQITEDHRGHDFFWLEAKKDNYVIGPNILSDEHFFIRLANLHSAVYDGWYASVV